jgi:hypothetical protein
VFKQQKPFRAEGKAFVVLKIKHSQNYTPFLLQGGSVQQQQQFVIFIILVIL